MKLFFSPSKGMKYKAFQNLKQFQSTSQNENLKIKTNELVGALKVFSKDDLSKIFKIKGSLLEETYNQYQFYYEQEEREAISLYDGVSFKQIDLESFSNSEFDYIKNNVLIFSALYGINFGSNLIRPYRLDMTNKILEISPYSFWNEVIENFLLTYKNEIFINIASKEFSKILNRKIFNVIDIEFRQIVDEKVKNISTEAKKARGAMLNYLIEIKGNNISQIKSFNRLGYQFSEEDSTENEFIFLKK